MQAAVAVVFRTRKRSQYDKMRTLSTFPTGRLVAIARCCPTCSTWHAARASSRKKHALSFFLSLESSMALYIPFVQEGSLLLI